MSPLKQSFLKQIYDTWLVKNGNEKREIKVIQNTKFSKNREN